VPDGYELIEEVGRGGMGVVYRARDLALDRGVAVKLLQDLFPADGPAARRFIEEARLTGRLQHPGIPPSRRLRWRDKLLPVLSSAAGAEAIAKSRIVAAVTAGWDQTKRGRLGLLDRVRTNGHVPVPLISRAGVTPRREDSDGGTSEADFPTHQGFVLYDSSSPETSPSRLSVLALPMPPAPSADSDIQERPYLKKPGLEPLPGYILIEPLGRGGFGEVWKCEAPGGLHKAIKFVHGDPDEPDGGEQFRQEFEAFQQIKLIRHPFLLTLERVELIEGTLVMVMELADRQLQDRVRECQRGGAPGIPRNELLGYLKEAAEALDFIGTQYGLQHLDVKPANLFLIANHVKVGDYGLVSRLAAGSSDGDHNCRGLTPRYVAPEVLRGEIATRSDQYSLALVYQELLTGTFPYTGKSATQLMLQHLTAPPNLAALPPCDRPAVGMALAKEPQGRFGSCVEFIQALLAGPVPDAVPGRAATAAPAARPGGAQPHPDPSAGTTPHGPLAGGITQNVTLPGPPQTVTGSGRVLPPLVTVTPPPRTPAAATPPPRTPVTGRLRSDPELPPGESERPARFRLNPIRSVVPVARLLEQSAKDPRLPPDRFAAAVVEAAYAGGHAPQMSGDVGRLADGTWVCQFPTTVPASVAPLKLIAVRDAWKLTVEMPDPLRVVFKKPVSSGGWGWSGKKSGFEVVVRLPAPGQSVGEVTVTGRLFGTPEQNFAQGAETSLPRLLADIRRELQNVEERRKYPRVAADFPVSIFPIHSDGGIDPPLPGRCKDVSAGGLALTVETKLRTKYSYVAFDGIAVTAGLAILVRVVRSQQDGCGLIVAGHYRMDL
jgi:serine/threonine protein kinase